jgi:hypothetical protein
VRFNEPRTLDLLHQAKPIVFPEIAVQADTRTRRDLMPASAADLMNKLNELDQRFFRCPDSLSAKLKAFAREPGLVSAETDDRQVRS